ncbi:hypothetical protein [Brevibacillus reuszeri]|uniref:hypothetical protein n=1 Tax=Brevibacillus reuszeri TaxID=54915 RepID=UPI000CCC795F|nr:hypothetical protein [Brevibacillus reuszeri]
MQKWEHNEDIAEPDDGEKDLPQPLDGEEYNLRYLPLVDLKSGKWIGAELLLVRNIPKNKSMLDCSLPEKSGVAAREQWVLQTA